MGKGEKLRRLLAQAQRTADEAQRARLKATDQLATIQQRERVESGIQSTEEQDLRTRMPAVGGQS